MMSSNRLKVKNVQIKNIFSSMDYGKLKYNSDIAEVWLKRLGCICISGCANENPVGTPIILHVCYKNISLKICTPDEGQIAALIDQTSKKTSWHSIGSVERIKLIHKFVAEIEKNIKLICQVELLLRGILPNDTKNKGIKTLTQYLMYYSNWCLEFEKLNIKKSSVAAIISDDNSLAILGHVIALGLISGAAVFLQTGPTISVCATLLAELAVNVGIPEGTIQIIPGIVHPRNILSRKIDTVYIFDDLYSENFTDLQAECDNHIIALANMKTSVVLFNNADLDSALDSIVNAVWQYQGLLPWSADTIIVQEDIFDNFVDKFKEKLDNLRVGCGNDESVDISTPVSSYAVQKLHVMIEDARRQGIEVYQSSREDYAGFKPTLFVGGKVYRNKVIYTNANDIPTATILAFRTASEAASLANNSRQGLAVSVWSENIDLVNEMIRKLNVGTVWINCHGIDKADVAFAPHKASGLGYFGGPEGFYDYCDHRPDWSSKQNLPRSDVNNVVLAAKNAQHVWSKLLVDARIQKLSKWALEIDNNKANFESEENVRAWISCIYDSFKELSHTGKSVMYGKYDMRTHHEPIGIIAVGMPDSNMKLITGALLLGNTVIVIADDIIGKKYSVLNKLLGFNLIYVTEDFDAVVNHKDVGTIISNVAPRNNTFTDYKKMYVSHDDWKYVLLKVTQIKNVWSTVGDSFV